MKILELMEENKTRSKKERTGIFTTGIISILDNGQKAALFFTGRNHGGENIDSLYQIRDKKMGRLSRCVMPFKWEVPSGRNQFFFDLYRNEVKKFWGVRKKTITKIIESDRYKKNTVYATTLLTNTAFGVRACVVLHLSAWFI